MVKRLRMFLVLMLAVFVADQKTALADHDSEKSKISKKYEVVSWGDSQRLTDNLVRVGKAIAGGGTSEGSLDVYRQRYRELKSHWNDADEKFKKKGVDTKNEPVYFGFIEWVQKSTIPVPSIPGVPKPPKIVTDHFIQFYVAARKKNGADSSQTVELLEPNSAPDGVRKARPNQRWRFHHTPTKGEYIVEWYDSAKDGWSNMALDNNSDGAVVLATLSKKSGTQRWQIEDAGDGCRVITESCG